MSDNDDFIDKWKEDAIGFPKPSRYDSFQQYFKRNSKNMKWITGIIIGLVSIIIAIIHK
jgi:hypothetical protein